MTDEKDDALDAEDMKVDEKTGAPVAPTSSSSSSSATSGSEVPAVRKCRVEPCNAICKGDTDYCECHQSKRQKSIPIAQPKVGAPFPSLPQIISWMC
jgi:hypothetical protein